MSVRMRLTATLLSRKPHRASLRVALSTLGVIALFSLVYWNDVGGMARYLPASARDVFQGGEFWRLVSGFLVHADIKHLASNALPMVVLSALFFGYFGWRAYPLGALGLGALIHALTLLSYSPHVRLLGISGLVYCLGAAWLILYVGIERHRSLRLRIFRVLAFALIFFVPSTYHPEVSYRAHGIGFGVGLLFGVTLLHLSNARIRGAEEHEWVDEDDEPSAPPTLH